MLCGFDQRDFFLCSVPIFLPSSQLIPPASEVKDLQCKCYNNTREIIYRTDRVTVIKCLDYETQHEQALHNEMLSSRSVPES